MDEADDQLREALVFHGVQVECKFMLIIVKPVPGGTHRGLDEGVLQEASCQTPEWSCRTTGGEEQLHSIGCGNLTSLLHRYIKAPTKRAARKISQQLWSG